MIYQKSNPIGLDANIAKIQKWLYQLNEVWGLVNESDPLDESKFIDAYERCYLIKEDEGTIVKRYINKGEYEPISVAEGNKFFFLNRTKAKKIDSINYTTDLELIFIVNLKELKPSIEHNPDLEVQNDVESLLSEIGGLCWIKELETSYEKVLNGIKYQQKNDVYPYHVFKFVLGINYSPYQTCLK